HMTGIAVSQLHTSNVAPLYASLGWTTVPMASVHAVVTPTYFRASADAMVMQEDDRQHLQALHKMYIARFAGCLERSDAFWHKWFPAEVAATNSVVCVLRKDNAVNGYIVAGPTVRNAAEVTMHAVVVRD